MRDREKYIQKLLDAFSSISRSGGRAVFVYGEAGIGKSTLIENFLSTLDEADVRAVAMCDPLNTPRPLGPVRDLTHAIIGSIDKNPDDAHFFEGFLHQLQSAKAPVVLVIEDLHWADQRSLDWLQFVARRLSQLPILLIGSYRDDEVDTSHPLRSALGTIPASRKSSIALAPLPLDTIEDLAKGSSLTGSRLLEITGGNPFFLTEVLSNEGRDQPVPISIADAVNSRLNKLDAEQQRFLETVSCCPSQIPYESIKKMPLGDVASLCDAAARKQILVPAGANFKFRHELARLAAYDRMAPASKREAHGMFLESLMSEGVTEDSVDVLVHHAQGAHRQDLILTYGPLAAKRAAQLGAHREAAQYLATVLKELDGQPPDFAAEICETWAYEAGLALAIDEDVIAARERAVKLWRQVGNAERVGENLRWLSRLHWYRGEAEIAQRYIYEAIDVLENEEVSPAKAKAFGLKAQFFMLQDQMVEAIDWGEKALRIARQVGDMEMVAHALNTIGSAKMFRGDRDGETMLRDSLQISLEHGFHEQAARVYTNLSECLVEARDLASAENLLEEGIAFDTANDLDSWTYYLVGRKAHLFFELDRYQEALAIAESVLARKNQTLLMRMPAAIIEARAKLRLGRPDAIAALDAALMSAKKINEPQYLVTLHIARIEAAVLADEAEAAEPSLSWISELDTDQLSPRKRGEYLFWARLAGQDLGPELNEDLPPAFVQFLSGQFEGAFENFQAEQSEYLSAWAISQNAEPSDIKQADSVFERIGATAARKALRKKTESQSQRTPLGTLARGPYRAAKRHPYGLTKTEQVVLAMIADGKSNAAMAAELSRSQRTVENHVSSILSKLRCKNKLEVVLRVQSEAWILHATDEAGSGAEP